MTKVEIYCVTNVKSKHLEQLNLNLAGVGNKKFDRKYISSLGGKNIQSKERNYSELTFHYWFWKNKLKKLDKDLWIGFCQKRRFWLKSNTKIQNFQKLKKNLILKPDKKWKKYNSIICKPIRVDNPKKMKIIKRGWRSLLKDPSVFYNSKKQTIKLHFDMHHGYDVLDKAIDKLDNKDRNQFRKFKGYDQKRLYAYLAERFLSFWFRKYTNFLEWHWTFYEKNK